MTDAEIIDRLRHSQYLTWADIRATKAAAADRIEALVKDAKAQESEIANLGENLDAQKRRAERLEAALRDAANVAARFGPSRPLAERKPTPRIVGRWEGEQAASAAISAAILSVLKGDDHV